MKLKLSVPAKNFILGEYAVLEQGNALLFTHTPIFTLLATEGIPQLTGIHLHSPAGRFYQQHFDVFSAQHVAFIDPYHGIGGLGASSAQFILLYALFYHLKDTSFSLESLLETYQSLAWQGEGYPPSGADLVAQSVGGMVGWNPSTKEVTAFDWPFADTLSLHFIHTHHKIKTHEHLDSLQLDFALDELKYTVDKATDALDRTDSITFCNAINTYANLLHQHQLTAPHTVTLLNSVKKLEGVKAAKGCGALGSDVLLVVAENTAETLLQDWINTHQLRYLGNQNMSAPGLSMDTLS